MTAGENGEFAKTAGNWPWPPKWRYAAVTTRQKVRYELVTVLRFRNVPNRQNAVPWPIIFGGFSAGRESASNNSTLLKVD